MRCFSDDKVCSCSLDDVSKGDCPRDPFRDVEIDDEETSLLLYLNGLTDEARSIHD